MAEIVLRTTIAAPPEVCFDLSRDVDVHAASTSATGERIVECPPNRILVLHDEVEFEAKHFGVRQRLRSRIVEYDRPVRFVDEMQRGAFKSLRHVHEFRPTPTDTLMIDVLTFRAPLGPLGRIAEIFLKPYLRRFLQRRNEHIRQLAESRQSCT